jgi:transcriptional regulator with XRE-family HTH domain
MTKISQAVGYRIRKMREAKDFTQDTMAAELKITAGAYAKIERGETDPSITRLFEIAKILKTDIVNLIQDNNSTTVAPQKADRIESTQEILSQLGDLKKTVDNLTKEVGYLKKSTPKKK